MFTDILDAAVTQIANDDYNHVPEGILRQRLADMRSTRAETRLWEQAADPFIEAVRVALAAPNDPEYGEG